MLPIFRISVSIRSIFVAVGTGAVIAILAFFAGNKLGDAQQGVALFQSRDNSEQLDQASKKIAALEKEIAELQTRQLSLTAQLPGRLAVVEPQAFGIKQPDRSSIQDNISPEPHGPDEDIQLPVASQAVAENEQSYAEQRAVQLKDVLLREGTEDSSWRLMAEQEIKYLAVDTSGSILNIITAECRSTLCGVEIIAEKQAFDNFITRLTSQLAWAASTEFNTVDDSSGFIKSWIYIGRKALPAS